MPKPQVLWVALVLMSPVVRSQPTFTAALAERAAPPPKPVAAVPAPMPAAQARNSQLNALHVAESPLEARDVVALSGTEAVRLTDANTNAVLSKPTLIAERVGAVATNLALPRSFWSKVSAHPVEAAFALPTRFTAFTVQGNQPVSFNIVLAVVDALHYDSGTGKFAGRLAMALVNSANHDDNSTLTHDTCGRRGLCCACRRRQHSDLEYAVGRRGRGIVLRHRCSGRLPGTRGHE